MSDGRFGATANETETNKRAMSGGAHLPFVVLV